MLFERFFSSSSNSSPSRRPLSSFFFPVDSRDFRSLCRLYQNTSPNAIKKRTTKPVAAPAKAAVRRETTPADGELTSVVGRTEVMVVPLTTVTIVVEPMFAVPVGETELKEEVDSNGGVEAEGVGVIFEMAEVWGVEGMGVDEDDANISAGDIGVVAVGVDGGSVVVGTGDDIVPVVDNIGETSVEITLEMDTGKSLIVKLPAKLVAAGLLFAAGLAAVPLAGLPGSVPEPRISFV